jgi:hypothetical protein
MSVSYLVSRGVRPQLGSPVIPVNPPARYLRHRIAAERAHRSRRQTARFRRLVALLCMGLLYLAIGREILQLTRAKMSLASTEMRSDAQTLAQSLKKMLPRVPQGGQMPAVPDQTPTVPDPTGTITDDASSPLDQQ